MAFETTNVAVHVVPFSSLLSLTPPDMVPALPKFVIVYPPLIAWPVVHTAVEVTPTAFAVAKGIAFVEPVTVETAVIAPVAP